MNVIVALITIAVGGLLLILACYLYWMLWLSTVCGRFGGLLAYIAVLAGFAGLVALGVRTSFQLDFLFPGTLLGYIVFSAPLLRIFRWMGRPKLAADWVRRLEGKYQALGERGALAHYSRSDSSPSSGGSSGGGGSFGGGGASGSW